MPHFDLQSLHQIKDTEPHSWATVRSIQMRVGADERAGRAPSNISMMIIRPPQHGHRRAGEEADAGPL